MSIANHMKSQWTVSASVHSGIQQQQLQANPNASGNQQQLQQGQLCSQLQQLQEGNQLQPTCLVYQQPVLAVVGTKQVLVGHIEKQVAQQELWVSLPAPGTYCVHVSCILRRCLMITRCSQEGKDQLSLDAA